MTTAITDLSPRDAASALLDVVDSLWARRLVDELDRAVRTEPLERFVELWDVSNAGAARVFGVSRQAYAKWLKTGPPAARAAAIADLAAATDILDRHVKRERIAAVVRRPASALGTRSLLDMAEAGETEAVARAVRDMFDLRRVQP
ncbi:MAG: hypothetical protein ACR2NG_04835 [Acidimicrobiia bacterium]